MKHDRTGALKAVGVYIRTLREGKNLTRKQLERTLDMSPMTIVRIEHGESDTRSTSMAAIVRAVGGSLDDVADLQLNPLVTEEMARDLALRRRESPLAPINEELTRLPATALVMLLDGLRLIAKKARERDVQGGLTIDRTIDSRITDDHIQRADEAWQTVVVAIRHLKDLGATDAELQFLLMNPDIPRECAERLAITRLGIGTIEYVLAKYAEKPLP